MNNTKRQFTEIVYNAGNLAAPADTPADKGGGHTPGPFYVNRHGTPDYAPQFGIYAENSGRYIAIVTSDNAKADADLFAAAPDLLAALQACLASAVFNSKASLAAVGQARAAIAKAEGRV